VLGVDFWENKKGKKAELTDYAGGRYGNGGREDFWFSYKTKRGKECHFKVSVIRIRTTFIIEAVGYKSSKTSKELDEVVVGVAECIEQHVFEMEKVRLELSGGHIKRGGYLEKVKKKLDDANQHR
jgi:hypothetical protein